MRHLCKRVIATLQDSNGEWSSNMLKRAHWWKHKDEKLQIIVDSSLDMEYIRKHDRSNAEDTLTRPRFERNTERTLAVLRVEACNVWDDRMLGDIFMAISLLTHKTSQELIMILTYSSFLDRLVLVLAKKMHREVKLRESLKDVSRRRMKLQTSHSFIWPKHEVALVKTRTLEELCLDNIVDRRVY